VDSRNLRFVFSATIASTFGSGFFPIAPGTVGAFIAIVVLYLLPAISAWTLFFSSVIFFFIGVWVSTEAEKKWGHDAGRINWDEVVGMMVTVLALPKVWFIYVVGFLLFRLFDVVKPYPANASQALPRGWGIMVDDVIAGIYSNIILQIVFRLILNYL